jgi:uncharacterized membrane protein
MTPMAHKWLVHLVVAALTLAIAYPLLSLIGNLFGSKDTNLWLVWAAVFGAQLAVAQGFKKRRRR